MAAVMKTSKPRLRCIFLLGVILCSVLLGGALNRQDLQSYIIIHQEIFSDTNDESSHNNLSSPRSLSKPLLPTTLTVPHCRLQSNHTTAFHHQHALARIVVFQRDGGAQLADLMAHYSQVLENMDAIILIDHQGTDPITASLLQQYDRMGAHIWRCDGPWKDKATMWTNVVGVYAKDSDFIFPLDVDELLAIKQPLKINNNNNNNTETVLPTPQSETLVWNKDAFVSALNRSALKSDGRAFKIETYQALPVPFDCPTSIGTTIDVDAPTTSSPNNNDERHHHHLPVTKGNLCRIGYLNRPAIIPAIITSRNLKLIQKFQSAPHRFSCDDKCFSVGKHFYKTDTGNHHLLTHTYQTVNAFVKCKGYLLDYYLDSEFVMVHVQAISFEGWFQHGLRGAEAKSFHLLPESSGCNPTPGHPSWHWCKFWMDFRTSNYSVSIMKEHYYREKCPASTEGFYPLDGVFGGMC
jgi:hypothetical protein